MQDCLDLRLKKSIEKFFADKFLLSNFLPIQTPIIEHLELFVRCVGKSSDVVGKEMFTIESASEERLCLRPEATAATFRAFLDAGIQTSPWKVFSSGPMFRHERPQKGRWREFEQFNVEIVDAKNFEHDVALIELFDRIFRRDFKLKYQYLLHLNFLGNSAERAAHRVELVKFLLEHKAQLCSNCVVRTEANPLRCFDCKNQQCKNLLQQAPALETFFADESATQWSTIQNQLTLLGVNFVKDPKLVRGLEYYSGTVFEFKSVFLGAQDAFCGGGRYDLAPAFGLQKSVPSVGAAVGIGRLQMLLTEVGLLPKLIDPPLHLIMPVEVEQRPLALMLLAHLVQAGLKADILIEDCSFVKMLRKASRANAHRLLIIGKTEMKSNIVLVKNMQNGEQNAVAQSELIKFLT
jgi:histidyl-tRNA synthetase